MATRVLTGWKEIEKFLGINRATILRLGYPVRKAGKLVQAREDELLRHLSNLPPVIADNSRC